MTQTPPAVLVIDVQHGLFDAERPIHDGAALLDRINAVTTRARAADIPIIFVQDDDVGALDSAAWQLHPALDVRPGDLRLRKRYADAFYHTSLDDLLRERGIGRLVILGCTTDSCIDMTSRRAVSLGYDVTLVEDGHSTRDNSFMPATASIAYYNVILDGFGEEDGFGSGQHSIALAPAADISF